MLPEKGKDPGAEEGPGGQGQDGGQMPGGQGSVEIGLPIYVDGLVPVGGGPEPPEKDHKEGAQQEGETVDKGFLPGGLLKKVEEVAQGQDRREEQKEEN